MAYEAERNALGAYLAKKSLKHTRQRDLILVAFLESQAHVTAEQLYEIVREINPSIGYTTVYRTLKLLVEADLAQERRFDDGLTRYEVEHAHHDHLVCLTCGRIVEFESPVIEEAQEKVAREHGFEIERHRHELYGHCPDCQSET